MTAAIDQVSMNFSPAATLALQGILALVILGISLELSLSEFRRLLQQPRAVLVGLTSQLIALPLLTFLLVLVLDPLPSLALGMMMTAACPGGNMSNVLTHWSGGRTSVSMTLTTVSSLVSPITTPLTFYLLGQLHPQTSAALRVVSVPMTELVMTIFVALLLPLMAGMWTAEKHPALTARIRGPLKKFGLVIFVAFVVLAVAANLSIFTQTMGAILVLVFLHNALGLLCGVSFASLFRLREDERRAVTFETGVHNTALGLTLIFSFYQGLGGMALVVGWWGIWQLITAGLLARYWSRRRPA